MKVAGNIGECVGNTPLVRIDRLAKQWGVKAQILVKIGYMNPGGSYKDRIGLQLIKDAEEAGHLKPGGTIIECTSGNTGMGLALAAISRGYRCVFVMPDKMSREKIDALRALGSEVIVTPTAVDKEDPRSYYSVAARLNKEIPNSWHSNQYENQSNPRAHYNTTGPEIWRDTDGKITAFVNGMGTGGTLSGVGGYLKEQNPNIKIVGVDPVGSMYFDKFHRDTDVKPETYLVEGIGEDFYPSTMNMSIVDDILQIDDKICQKRCDHGLRYLSKVFNEQWLRENEMLESEYELEASQLLGTKSSGPRVLVSVTPEASAASALKLLRDHDVSQIPVVGPDGRPVGSLQEAQLVELFVGHKDLASVKVSEVMGPPFPIVSGDTPLEEVASQLTRENPAVLVEDEGGFGIVTKYDLIAHIAR